jgi:ribonuclease T2
MKALLVRFLVVLVVAGIAADAALSQRYRDRYQAGDADRGYDRREHRPGEFDYYVLALSWSPTYCAERTNKSYEPQCDARSERPYAFVLHGLWPQYERGWPQDCRAPDRGWVPGPVANRMLDIMPSKRLVFHEYRKHGTCSGLGVDSYFGLARQLYQKVRIPERYVRLTDDRLVVGPGELIGEFLEANPELRPDMIAVQCGGAGNRLKEVRVCFTKSGSFRGCGPNENQRRLCSADRMYVPPVRYSSGGKAFGGPTDLPREIVPLPK